MTKDEASILAKNISDVALDIMTQLKDCNFTPTLVESFYLRLLERLKLILNDTSTILKNNHEQQLTSSFILLRVLLDDYIRVLSVCNSPDANEEVTKIQADALKHKFKVFQENADINSQFFNNKNIFLITQTILDEAKSEILANSNFDLHFINKNLFKFKNLTNIANVIKDLNIDDKTKKAIVHSFVLYKELTRHVHYTHLSYPFESEEKQREYEISIFKEVMIYCTHMAIIYFSFFKNNYPITWTDIVVKNFYNTNTENDTI